MSLKNPYGDFEITEPQALRALAHPVRLAILDRLQRHGPATATGLSPHVGATPSVVSWHLRHLATFGLVLDAQGTANKRERWWRAASRGFRFTPPDDAEGQAAGRQLRGEMFARYAETPQQWMLHDEPRLNDEWRGLAGLADTQFLATPDELRHLETAIEELLAPYVLRKDDDTPPAGAQLVRMLRYLLPDPGDDRPAS
ncbi:helix-turn-helix transcriptional regulator [Micromonospora sp. ALFpr18c]|uniref:ArsR/SmtB family transcription factor n=1 Tax=unclassified Micromonospora TaxID=2617518 RepID=UPI00124B1479|nr:MULTISPECIES: helix-turn-helix domain-containing protein [unclassified Micromonospora]KAB1932032.1 helix-turn-helix transcriptional regulator [Micromonospora sp. ALFpr18c]MDG4758442.1 helix-turn-helix domain-containing protein [Micromonospora sp. WMMD710]